MPAWPATVAVLPVPSTPPPPHTRGAALRRVLRPCGAKKGPGTDERAGATGSGGVVSRGALLRSGAALFALGFIDAGYSGDWSRVGAISKDTEELLKLGAYAVVPLCLAFVFLPSPEDGSM